MGQDKKPDMYLITHDFPYGHREDSFVRPEYPYLCEYFHVSVIAAEMMQSEKRLSEEEVRREGIEACIIPTGQSVPEKLYSLLRFLLEKDCYTELISILKSREKIPQRIYRALMFGTAAETFYRRLRKRIRLTKDTQALFYFYWFDYKCFGLTMHRRRYPQIRIVARTHGYDLYDHRELYGKQFFKPQMDEGLKRLIFAAQFAREYYLERYGLTGGEKYPLHRLGVRNRNVTGEDRRAGYRDNGEFLLLSCSSGRVKRVEKIIEGLSCVTTAKVRWVHIGGGEELAGIQELAQKKLDGRENIQYEFAGMLLNTEVVEYYRTHYVGCLITTTRSEGGSPVAVQEALSFGVPVIATAVGELPQMVAGNGILLSEDPTVEETARAIERMAGDYGTDAYFRMCEESLKIFAEKFNEQRNFKALAEELASL